MRTPGGRVSAWGLCGATSAVSVSVLVPASVPMSVLVLVAVPVPVLVPVLGREGPFPLILLPQFGGYWIEGTNHQLSGTPVPSPPPTPATRAKLECNHTAKIYRKHFLGKEHFNYYSLDAALGHLVFSLKYDEQEHLHLLLR
nr:PREDICTED: rap1 GTPase-activating protein 1 [Struthio camelus australis]